MTEALKAWVMEAAGNGYLTDAQIVAVVRTITRELRTRSPESVGVAELMQLIELARTEGLYETDDAPQEIIPLPRSA